MSEFKTPKDVLPLVFEDLESIYGTESVPPLMHVRVDWRSRTVRFEPAGYEIDLNLIRDEGHIIEWVKHLSDKNWATKQHLVEFMEAATINLRWMRSRKMA